MKFLADESVEGIVVFSLRELGQDVLAISESIPGLMTVTSCNERLAIREF